MWFLRLTVCMGAVLLFGAGNACADHGLRYAGATTLQRYYMPEIARIFTDATAIKVHIQGGNTGPGIRALLNGEIDLAGAGRLLTADEKSKGLVEHFLGWDTLAIIVHEENPVESLSLEQLQGIFTGKINDWQDVGGNPGPIVVVTSPRGSGMRSAIKDLILKDKDFSKREIISAIVAEADQQISMFKTGITALSHSMLDANNVKAILVGGAGPSAENIKNDSYPLAKPLALITKGEPQGDLARFFDVVRSEQGRAILQKSFVPVH